MGTPGKVPAPFASARAADSLDNEVGMTLNITVAGGYYSNYLNVTGGNAFIVQLQPAHGNLLVGAFSRSRDRE